MTLVLRRQGSPFVPPWDKDRFWTVLHQTVPVGVLVETRGRSDGSSRWDWTLQLHAGPFFAGSSTKLFGSAETRDLAASAFRSAFDAATVAIGDGGWANHVAHHRMLAWRAQQGQGQVGGTDALREG